MEFRERPLTGNASSFSIHCSQGRAFTPWKSSSKLRASKLPSSIRTRSPYREPRLARASIDASPVKNTRPFCGSTFCASIAHNSSPTSPSIPNRHGITIFHCSAISMLLFPGESPVFDLIRIRPKEGGPARIQIRCLFPASVSHAEWIDYTIGPLQKQNPSGKAAAAGHKHLCPAAVPLFL